MAQKIRRLREWRRWSIRRAASEVGVSASLWSAWERGETEIRWSRALDIAKAFDVDVAHVWDSSIPPLPETEKPEPNDGASGLA